MLGHGMAKGKVWRNLSCAWQLAPGELSPWDSALCCTSGMSHGLPWDGQHWLLCRGD